MDGCKNAEQQQKKPHTLPMACFSTAAFLRRKETQHHFQLQHGPCDRHASPTAKKKPVNLTMPSSKSLPKGFCKCRTEDTKLLKQYYYNI